MINKREILDSCKITNFKWINLFQITGKSIKGQLINWIFASRKKDPINDKNVDAVVIVPILKNSKEDKIVMIKEYRWPVMDFEYGFPAGLIDVGETIEISARRELKEETGLNLTKIINISNKIYTSPGLTDESCVIVFAEAEGEITNNNTDSEEDIEVLTVNIKDIKKMFQDSDKKIGAKSWGILYYFNKIGKIKW
jgi:ADP-ribose pyrophosphatase